jgi:hypothetical protein
MEGRGARFLGKIRPGLEHRDRNAAAGEMCRRDKPDGPRAGDENTLLNCQTVAIPKSKVEAVA